MMTQDESKWSKMSKKGYGNKPSQLQTWWPHIKMCSVGHSTESPIWIPDWVSHHRYPLYIPCNTGAVWHLSWVKLKRNANLRSHIFCPFFDLSFCRCGNIFFWFLFWLCSGPWAWSTFCNTVSIHISLPTKRSTQTSLSLAQLLSLFMSSWSLPSPA